MLILENSLRWPQPALTVEDQDGTELPGWR
jgi:hypothetical protein